MTHKTKTRPAADLARIVSVVHINPAALGIRLDYDARWSRHALCGIDCEDTDPAWDSRPMGRKWSGMHTTRLEQATCHECCRLADAAMPLVDAALEGGVA